MPSVYASNTYKPRFLDVPQPDISDYTLDLLERYAKRYGITLYPDTVTAYESVEEAASSRLVNCEVLPDRIRHSVDPELRFAGAYYQLLIKPLFVRARDAKRPDALEVYDFCERLSKGQSMTFVMHYAFIKNTTECYVDSLNGVIDFAELEMLKYFALLTKVARMRGFLLNVTFVDETSLCPTDLFCITERQQLATNNVIGAYIQKNDVSDRMLLDSTDRTVVRALGDAFGTLYQRKIIEVRGQVARDIRAGGKGRTMAQLLVFLNFIPEAYLLREFNLESEQLGMMKATGDALERLSLLSGPLQDKICEGIAHFQTVMDLRGSVEKASSDSTTRIVPISVRRSYDRWSISQPVKYKGQSINPTYGHALYGTEGEYRGVVNYSQLQRLPFTQIIRHEGRPIGAIEQLHA